MAKLKDKVKHALDESIILVTGIQLLIGFEFRAPLETSFNSLPQASQFIKLVTLCLTLITLGFLVSTVAYHRAVDEGQASGKFLKFTRKMVEWALLPFAASLGLSTYVITQKVAGFEVAVGSGLLVGLVALFFWYGLEALKKGEAERRRQMEQKKANEASKQPSQAEGQEYEKVKLSDKVEHVLSEARVVLPGAQALLGLQFAAVLMEGFDRLPALSRYLHLASLSLIALSVVLLITPAAYHRIVEQGEDTEHFHSVAGRLVLYSLAPLGLGLTLEFYVIADKITRWPELALALAGLLLVFFYGLWFGYTALRKSRRPAGHDEPAASASDKLAVPE